MTELAGDDRVAIFTGTRAEFGLLQPVGQALLSTRGLEPSFIVGGTHTDPEFGSTMTEIDASGLPVGAVLPAPAFGTDNVAISQIASSTLAGSAEALERLSPRLALVLGDRYESLAFATACLLARIPLAHIHGGEITRGAVDDSIRNAITQMADLHLVAAVPFADRVKGMIDNVDSVHVTGAPGLDAIRTALDHDDASRDVVESLTGPLPDSGPIVLLAHHPESRSADDQGQIMASILDALLDDERSVILTSAPNADWGRDEIATVLHQYRTRHPDRIRFVASFGHHGFAHAMALADLMIGNSSAGVIEAPLVGTPSITVGDRQTGRPLAETVIACGTTPFALRTAIDQARQFSKSGRRASTLYGDGYASDRIAGHVKDFLDQHG